MIRFAVKIKRNTMSMMWGLTLFLIFFQFLPLILVAILFSVENQPPYWLGYVYFPITVFIETLFLMICWGMPIIFCSFLFRRHFGFWSGSINNQKQQKVDKVIGYYARAFSQAEVRDYELVRKCIREFWAVHMLAEYFDFKVREKISKYL